MSQSALQRILHKNFQDILKEKKSIKSVEIINHVSKGLDVLKKNVNLNDNHDIIHPLISIVNNTEASNVKCVGIALSSLQQLIIQRMLSDQSLATLLEAMIQMLSTEEYGSGLSDESQNHTVKEEIESIHVKFLQINFMILSSGGVQYNQSLLAKLLALFFRMHRTKGPNESQISLVGIQQISTFIFDTLAKASQIEKQDENLSSIVHVAKSAYLFFSDLAQILKSNDTSWMKVKNVDRCLAAEFIEDILEQYSQLLVNQDDFCRFLNDTFPTILTQFFQNSQRYSLVLRVFRITAILSQQLAAPQLKGGCFSFLDALVEMTKDNSSPLWKRVLAFEVFKKICKDHDLLQRVFEQDDIKFPTDLLNKICLSVRFYIEKTLTTDAMPLNFQHSANQFKRLEKDSTLSMPFQTSVDECISNCIDCLMGLVESMSIIALTSKNESKEQLLSVCSNMIECSWPSILVSLSSLLEGCNSEDTINTVLRAYLLITNTCSVANITTARDAFLTNLCKFSPSLPNSPHNLQSSNTDEAAQITLSKKNVLVAQTIVDIAQAIGEQLGSSWGIILQSFSDLNDFLIDYQKNTIMSRNVFLTDLKNITRTMESLIKSTKSYPDENFLEFITALCNFYKTNPAVDSGLFVTAQMMEVLKLNIYRINIVWPVVQTHMLNMIEHDVSFIRQQGIEDIFSLIHEFYTYENQNETTEDKKEETASEMHSTTGSDSKQSKLKEHIELDLFTLLLTISSSVHTDSKQLMIENLTTTIEQYGELITSAWSIILTVLRSIDSVAKLIPIAFKSVQLIGGNIRYLTTDGLLEYMKTIEYFATQRIVDDFNISLVAISLLWNLSDFMVKSTVKDRKTDLFISLFTSIRKCVIDPRPEVRNAAVRTLLFAIASHGAELDVEAWGSVVQKVLIPVLRDMQEYSNKADRNVMHSAAKQANLYVHHSRNTEAKQWSETNCLAIENISRVVKEHSELLIQVPGFLDEGCNTLIGFIHASFGIQTSEIARVIITSMFDIFTSGKGEIRRILWNGLWPLWAKFVDDGCSGEKYVSGTLLMQLIESFTNLYRTLLKEDFLNHQDILELIELAKKVLLSKSASNVVSHPSSCQKAVLYLLVELSGFSDAIREEIFSVLASFTDYMPTLNGKDKDGQEPMHIDVATSILETLIDNIYTNASENLQKLLFVRLVNILGKIMVTRFSLRLDYDLWRNIVTHFINIVNMNIEMITNLPPQESDSYWESLANAIEEFLFPAHGTQLKLLERGQHEEVKIINLIGNTLLQASGFASDKMKRRILAILEKATHTSPRVISHESMQCLFRIVAKGSEIIKAREQGSDLLPPQEAIISVAVLTIPRLYHRCKEIMQRYISDDEQSGEMPLPSYRRQEMVHIFQQLKEQNLHKDLCEAIPNNNTKLGTDVMNGPKGMTIRLFPLLSQFTRSSIQDLALKSLLCDLLSILSEEFGFTQEKLNIY